MAHLEVLLLFEHVAQQDAVPEIDPGEEASTDSEHPGVVIPVEKAHITSGLGAP